MYVNICVHRNMNYLRSFRRSGLKTLVIVNQMQGTRSGALEKDCLSTGFPTTNNRAKLVYEKSTSSGSVLWVASRWKNVSYEEVIRTFYNVPGPEGGFSKSRRERGVNCSVEKEPDCHGFVIKTPKRIGNQNLYNISPAPLAIWAALHQSVPNWARLMFHG